MLGIVGVFYMYFIFEFFNKFMGYYFSYIVQMGIRELEK